MATANKKASTKSKSEPKAKTQNKSKPRSRVKYQTPLEHKAIGAGHALILWFLSIEKLGAMTAKNRDELLKKPDLYKDITEENSYSQANMSNRLSEPVPEHFEESALVEQLRQQFIAMDQTEGKRLEQAFSIAERQAHPQELIALGNRLKIEQKKQKETIRKRVERAVEELERSGLIHDSPLSRAVKKGERPDLSKQHFPRYVFNSERFHTHMRVFTRDSLLAQVLPEQFIEALFVTESDHAENSGAHTEAQQLLQKLFDRSKYQRGMKKVARVEFNTQGFAPIYRELQREHFETILDALINERQVNLEYKKDKATEPGVYRFSPVGLVFYRAKCYLLGKREEPEQNILKKLLVQRIQSIEATDLPINECCKRFNLQQYLESGFFEFSDQAYDFTSSNPPQPSHRIDLHIKCANQTTYNRMTDIFATAKTTSIDSAEKADSSPHQMKFKTAWTTELEHFLLGESYLVEVIAPEALRQVIKKRILDAAKRYGKE